MVEKFIQSAIKHPGSLRRWAKKHRLLKKDGTIDLGRAKAYCQSCGRPMSKCRCPRHRMRQIILAQTLRKLNR